MTTTMVANDGIGWRTMMGKAESGQQTMTVLGRRDREDNVVFGVGHTIFCCKYDMLFFAGVI